MQIGKKQLDEKLTSARSYRRKLSKVLQQVNTVGELEEFLEDFFTPGEIKQFVERWNIADLLLKGLPQRQVKDRLGVSISKVSRGSSVLQHGRGAVQRVWQSLKG